MIQLLGTFFLISLSGALSPGPLTTMAVVEGAQRGKHSGWRLSLGHGLVEAPFFALIALAIWAGRSVLLEQPTLTATVALVGGLFLIWMGSTMAYSAWKKRAQLEDGEQKPASKNLLSAGALVTLSNPYWWLWWPLVTPLYLERALSWGIAGLVLLYMTHWLTDFGWLTGLSWLSARGRSIISPATYRAVLIVSGLLLLFFGATFMALGLRYFLTGTAVPLG